MAAAPLSERAPRVLATRRLTRRRDRERAGAFLAEGPQAIRAALAADAVRELFHTDAAAQRHPELVAAAPRAIRLDERAAGALSETTHPQGLVAVCALPERPELPVDARLVCVLADARDPGNAGTVLRCADAAGADAVVFAGNSVDPYSGKCVRAAAGSHFHLPVVRGIEPLAAVAELRRRGLQVLAADGSADVDLDAFEDGGRLGAPTGWLFGNEAWGLPAEVAAATDAQVRIPIHGRAESLNLATAAAVCLYASARAQRRQPAAGSTP